MAFPIIKALPQQKHVLYVLKTFKACMNLFSRKKTIETVMRRNPFVLYLRDTNVLHVYDALDDLTIPVNNWYQLLGTTQARFFIDADRYLPCLQTMKQLRSKPITIVQIAKEMIDGARKVYIKGITAHNSITEMPLVHLFRTTVPLTDSFPLRGNSLANSSDGLILLMGSLKALGFYNDDILDLLRKFPASGRAKTVDLISLGRYLEKLRLERRDIVKMFLNYPRLMVRYTPVQVKIKLGYIVRVMRLPVSMVVDNPVVLTYSLRRIGSRLEYVRNKKPALLKEYALPFWTQPTDKDFTHRRKFPTASDDYFQFKTRWSIQCIIG
jgi:hypothetical protein